MPMFLDFEASGLYNGSYPIEAGMAWDEAGEVRSESFLITPHKSWQSWSIASEGIHGIPRALLLTQGIPVKQAALRVLLRIEAADSVHSDAPDYEKIWLNALLTAGEVDRFRRQAAISRVEDAVEAWGMACSPLLTLLPPSGSESRNTVENWIRNSAMTIVAGACDAETRRARVRHRALPDAEGLLWTWKETRRRAEAAALARKDISGCEITEVPLGKL